MSTKQIAKHFKCRGGIYPHSNIKRLTVPDDLVDWCISWPEYSPPVYNSNILTGKPWADPDIG